MYQESTAIMPSGPTRNSITERLEAQKEEFERRLTEINLCLDALKENPEIQKVLDTLSKFGLY